MARENGFIRSWIRSHQRTPSGSRDFKEATKRDALARVEVDLERLLASMPENRRALVEKEFRGFKNLFSRFLAEQGPSVTWEKIEKLPEGAVIDYSSLPTPTTDNVHHMLDKLVVVKLNGGLGTSMGCKGPKSVIQVRNELTFLDLTVQQIEHLNKTYKCNVPLVLMNSFNTDEDTQKVIRKYQGLKLDIHTFNQSCHPRINRESLLPVAKTGDVHADIEAQLYINRYRHTYVQPVVPPAHLVGRMNERLLVVVRLYSFNTDEDTQKVIRKYQGLKLDIHTFNQSCHPRINRESLLPVAKTGDVHADIEAWYPPGHGDFYESFNNSGLLQKFIKEGRTYCFISNIDNLGATVDLNILNLLLNPDPQKTVSEFVMEVTDKTRADVKGGTLIQYEDKLRLLEIAQVPKEHVDDFKSVSQFKFFNTNNLWAKLDAIQRVVEQGSLNMEIIVNNKHLGDGINVIQLETAVGAAMKCFEGGIGVNVPRSRFLPVKKTSDLLLVMSNLYSLSHGSLVMSPQRMFPTTPLVKLGDNHFAKVKEFLNRFATIPDLIELDHLTVSGDVTFGRGVALKGTVIIIANHGDRIDIPSGALLENKIVSGNLRILDH